MRVRYEQMNLSVVRIWDIWLQTRLLRQIRAQISLRSRENTITDSNETMFMGDTERQDVERYQGRGIKTYKRRKPMQAY